MNLKQKVLIAIFIFTPMMFAQATAAEDSADFHQKGIAALKDSQTNPNAIVAAARYFAKASALYEASGKTELAVEMNSSALYETNGKTELAVEMNSYLYWCKKKMTMAQIDSFLKTGETTVANRLAATESKPIAQSEAQTWMDRAAAFERANNGEPFLIAVRYFEVADRFKDTEAGRAAMAKSLQVMQKLIESQRATAAPKPTKVTPQNAIAKKVSLLPLIDPLKDVIEGKWHFVSGVLISEKVEKGENYRISIPYMPPDEYDFSVEFMRLKGNECVQLILSKAGNQFMYVLGGDGGQISGFDVVDGKNFNQNDSGFRGKVIVDGKRQTLVIKVRNDRVTAILDGQQLSETKVPFEKLTMRNDWRIRRKELLGLSLYKGSYAFYSANLTEITGQGSKERP